MDFGKHFGFILFYPLQLGGCEIPWRIKQVLKCVIFPQPLKGILANFNRPAIAPDNRRAKHMLFTINADEAVHLVRNAYGLDVTSADA